MPSRCLPKSQCPALTISGIDMGGRQPLSRHVGLITASRDNSWRLGAQLSEAGYVVSLAKNDCDWTQSDLSVLSTCSLLVVDEKTADCGIAQLHALQKQLRPQYLPLVIALAGVRSAEIWLQNGFDGLLPFRVTSADLAARLGAICQLCDYGNAIVLANSSDPHGQPARLAFADDGIASLPESFDRSTIDALSDHICVIDGGGLIRAVNRAWRDFNTDHGGDASIDWFAVNYLAVCDLAATQGGADAAGFAEGLRSVLLGDRDHFSIEYPCGIGEDERWFLAKVTRFYVGTLAHAVIAHENVTQEKLAQRHLIQLAHFDNLTGLPNRLLFYDRLCLTLRQSDRVGGSLAVMFIDLDHFKLVNDTMGHAAGDDLLREASQRIVACVRSNDTVGRLGGDEFGVCLPDLLSAHDAALVAQKVMASMARPFVLGLTKHFVTCSVGISVYPSDGCDADTLICNADAAMYRAKQWGRNTYQFFTTTINAQNVERVKIDRGLRMALEREELFLEYQPQRDFANGRIVGIEALLRWRHPELGTVPPASFIPIAEETGLIIAIGEWAMRQACRQNRLWQSAGLAPLVIAVNLSARQFRDETLAGMVENILKETGLDGRWLELELTEGTVMDNTESLIATMHILKLLGVRLSLDDFGTGYSNLSYLKRFPLDSLKIDRSFIRGIAPGNDDAVIAATVINLGHGLRLCVTAEGVETDAQNSLLCKLGCDVVQGYFFSPPLAASAMTKMLTEAAAV